MSTPNLSSLTVLKLREICKNLGVTVGGKKADLIERILAKQGGINTAPVSSTAQGEANESGNATRDKEPQVAIVTTGLQQVPESVTSGTTSSCTPVPGVSEVSKKRKLAETGRKQRDDVVGGQDEKAVKGGDGNKMRGKGRKVARGEPIGKDPEKHEPLENVSLSGGNGNDLNYNTIGVIDNSTSLVQDTSTRSRSTMGKLGLQKPEVNAQKVKSTGKVHQAPTKLPAPLQPPDTFRTQLSCVKSRQSDQRTDFGATSATVLSAKGLELNRTPVLPQVRRTVPPILSTTQIQSTETTNSYQASSARAQLRNNDSAFEKEVEPRNMVTNHSFSSVDPGTAKNMSSADEHRLNTKVNQKRGCFVRRKKLNIAVAQAAAVPFAVTESNNLQNVVKKPSIQDIDIYWKPIRFPPGIALRGRVERLSRILALVANYSPTIMEPGGRFLSYTITLSKAWHYASVLAFSHLCNIYEFGGRRTTQWIRLKRVDAKIADFRRWYWYRVQQREKRIDDLRTNWWGERVWKEYILANEPRDSFNPVKENALYSFRAFDMKIVNENEAIGQWEIAARFWERRFCATIFSGNLEKCERNTQEALGGGEYTVTDLHPVGENGVQVDGSVSAGGTISEVWVVVTKRTGLYFIIGSTGEVIGSLQEFAGNKRKTKLLEIRTNTTISATGATSRFTQWSSCTRLGKDPGDNLEKCIASSSLRIDWKNYTTQLIMYANQAKRAYGRSSTILAGYPLIPVPLLLSRLYHPSPMQFTTAIHEKLIHSSGHRRVLAERFILAHAEEYGFSGGKGNPISGGKKVGFEVDCKWRIESVVCPGEEMKSGGKIGKLGNGVAFVQTVEGGWYMLEATGEIIGQEDYGISEMWSSVLGVDEAGFCGM